MGKIFWIPGNVPSKKNGKTCYGNYLVPSKLVSRYIKESTPHYRVLAGMFSSILAGLPKPYYIEFTFIRKSRHKFDYTGAAETVQDQMKDTKWLDDDNANEIMPYFNYYKYNKKNPGVEIRILKNKPVHYEVSNILPPSK